MRAIDITKIIFSPIQKILLVMFYYLFKAITPSCKQPCWVIGVDENASNIFFLSKILSPCYTVALNKDPYFYDLKYDYCLKIKNKYARYLARAFYGPILCAYLATRVTHYFYIWSTGFLFDREYEFKFLKTKGKKIVCMFIGDDIGSPKLLTKYLIEQAEDGFVEYVGICNPRYLSVAYDREKQEIATASEKYSDLIFSGYLGKRFSYLKHQPYRWPYMYPKSKFRRNDKKFTSFKQLKIVHAPSNPLVKGTPLVRAAIKKLLSEGYKFEYIELIGVDNQLVLQHLRSSHIVLNQFYHFMPGLFGVEAMANHCAVLQSAEQTEEANVPEIPKDAWLVTKYWQVYDKLKYLLDNPEVIKYYADNGYELAINNYTYEQAGKLIKNSLQESGIWKC